MNTSSLLSERINSYLESLNYSRTPKELYAPISYTLSLGGKRLRPLLMLMGANLWTEDTDALLPAAAGLEIYHNFTLLHDDLMDKADRRRNQLTVHRKWNENVAILSGDTMLILAYEYFMQTRSPYMESMVRSFTTAAREVCEGQQMDMEFESRCDVTETEYLEMIRLKTSVLLAAALRIGAEYAGAPVQDAEKLYRFGESIGLAFQLQDDYLDVYGDPKTFGKNIGGDILCNKKTWMLIKCLQKADDQQEIQLRGWMNRKDYLAEEKIAAVTELYDATNIPVLALEAIEYYYRKGLQELDSIAVPEEKKSALKAYVEQLLKRNK